MSNRKENKKSVENIDPKRKRIFKILLILIPFFLLALIEITLRIAHYGSSFKLFQQIDYYGKPYYRCNQDYGKKYFNIVKYTTPSNDIFAKNKPKNGFRIFVLGSSSTVGFPYSEALMFSRILGKRLQDSYPNKKIEVVNIGITAVNSFTLQDRIDEVLQHEPDAILIYAGHNEFYGALGVGSREGIGKARWIKLLHLKLLNFRTYQLIRQLVGGIQKLFVRNAHQDAATATLMQRIVANKGIAYKSPLYNLALNEYRKNMASILRKAKRQKVPVFFSEVVSNLKLPPLGSMKTDKYPPAIDVYDRGIAELKAGNYVEAKKDLYLAKDLDCIRFRASGDINLIIRDLAHKYGTYFIPMDSIFQAHSPHGIIGNNLISEHLHPNYKGYFLVADAFYNAITKSGLIGPLDSANYKPSDYYASHWGFTSLDSMSAALLVHKLEGGWPFKPDTVVNSFIRDYKPKNILDSLAYLSVRYEDITLENAHQRLAKYYMIHNETDKAIKEYYAILEIDPYTAKFYVELGDILVQAQKLDEALKIYKEAYSMNSDDIYVRSMIGEVYAKTGDFKDAIPFLEEVNAQNRNFRSEVIASSLYKSYLEVHDTLKAKEFYKNNRDLLSEPSEKGRKEVILRLPEDVKPLIAEAIKCLHSNQIRKAQSILLQANKISETSIANRFLADIFFQQRNSKALYYLKKVYPEYNTDPEYLNTFCYASLYFKDYPLAKKLLPELKQFAPNNPNIPVFEKMLKGE